MDLDALLAQAQESYCRHFNITPAQATSLVRAQASGHMSACNVVEMSKLLPTTSERVNFLMAMSMCLLAHVRIFSEHRADMNMDEWIAGNVEMTKDMAKDLLEDHGTEGDTDG